MSKFPDFLTIELFFQAGELLMNSVTLNVIIEMMFFCCFFLKMKKMGYNSTLLVTWSIHLSDLCPLRAAKLTDS